MFVESYGQMAVQGTSFSPPIDSARRNRQPAARGRRLLVPQRLAHLLDVRRRQLVGARHAAVGSLGQQPRALLRADQEQPSHAHRPHSGAPGGGRSPTCRRPTAPGRTATPSTTTRRSGSATTSGTAARNSASRPCRTSTFSRPCRGASWRSGTGALSSPRSTPRRATSRGPASRRSSPGGARERIDLQPPAGRPDRLDRHPAGVREVDQVHAPDAVLVRRALRQQEPVLIVLGDHQPSRVVARRPGHDVPISIIAHDPKVLEQDRRAGAGRTGCARTRRRRSWLMSAFRNRLPQRVRPGAGT